MTSSTTSRAIRLARLVVIGVLAVVALGAVAAPATAATPCWKRLINDWYDGRIDGVYPPSCYRAAIDNLPDDVDVYSSAREDIERELLAAISRNNGKDPDLVYPTGNAGRDIDGDDEPGDGDASGAAGRGDGDGDDGLFGTALDHIQPSNADSIPVPLLILSGLALLLLAAAAASFAARRLHARRVRVSPISGERPNR